VGPNTWEEKSSLKNLNQKAKAAEVVEVVEVVVATTNHRKVPAPKKTQKQYTWQT